MVYVSSPPQQHLHISVCSIGSCLSSSKMERWGGKRGGGKLPSSLWGLVQAHETAGVLQKPIIEAPAPPPGRTGGGGERDC